MAIKRYINHCGGGGGGVGIHSLFKRCYLHFAVCAQLIETVCARRGRDRNLLLDINFVTCILVVIYAAGQRSKATRPGREQVGNTRRVICTRGRDIATTTSRLPMSVFSILFSYTRFS